MKLARPKLRPVPILTKVFDHNHFGRGRIVKTAISQAKHTAKQGLGRKKWAVFLIFALVLLPSVSVPAEGAIFDPIIKVILPFYERIIGKAPPAQVPSVPTPDSEPVSSAPAPVYPPYQTQDTPTPDLLALLHAEFAADRDDPETALRLYKGEALKENAAPVFERALVLSMQLESPDKTLAFAKDWQDKNSDHVPVWFYVTHFALKAEDYPKAAQNLKLILSYDPKADLSQIFAGILPNTPEAQRALFTEIQSIDIHENPSLSVLKAGLLGQLNEPIPAILHLNNAINADKNNLAYYLLKADILKSHDPKGLIQFLKDSVKTTKGNTKKQLYLYHARHLLDQNNLDGAWAVLTSAGDLRYEDEMALLGGLLALDLNYYDDANRLLLGLTDNPEHQSEAYYYLGISHERTGELEKALDYFAKVDDMQYVLPATKKQVAYEMLFGNPDGAIERLGKLRQNFEMYASDSYLLQADVLKQLGKTDEAHALLDGASADFPDDPSLLFAKLDFMQDKDAKLSAINSLLEFDPNNPRYRLAFAKLVLADDPHDQTAKQMLIAIGQMSDDDPDFDAEVQHDALIFLGKLVYEQGDYEQVVAHLTSAYDQTADLEVGKLLLLAQQKLGNNQEVERLLSELQERFGGGRTGN